MTMEINIKYFNVIRDVTENEKETVFLAENSTIKFLLNDLVDKYSQEFRDYVFDKNGMLQPYIRLTKNNKLITNQNLNEKLNNGDEVGIFITHAGG